MLDPVRVLNEAGSRLFREFVERAKAGSTEAPPFHLLTDNATSEPSGLDVAVEQRTFVSRIEFGRYLADAFSAIERRRISRDAGLWNWLALFYFDQLCPSDSTGHRKVLGAGHYVLEGRFAYNRYYRHLVRFPWFATVLHGERAAILLTAAGKATPGIGQWGELSEQLAGYQDILGSRAAVEVAARLYLDADGKPVRGAASPSGPGSVRRLSMVLRQLAMLRPMRSSASCLPSSTCSKELPVRRRGGPGPGNR